MKKFLIVNLISLIACFCSNLQTKALEIIYPKTQTVEVCANSTFFVGNTEPGSKLKINNKRITENFHKYVEIKQHNPKQPRC